MTVMPNADSGDQAVKPDPTWERLEDQLGWYDGKAVRSQRDYKRVKIIELVVAAAVPVLAGLNVRPAITASAAAVVVILEGLQQLYQWHTNWVQYRSTAEALKREKYLYQAQAGPYADGDRHRTLAERLEGLISHEHSQWTQGQQTKRTEAGNQS